MASETSTLRCGGCDARVLPGAAWCGLCLTPMPAAPATSGAGPFGTPATVVDGGFRAVPPAPNPALFTESRWRSSSMTFGPVGRVVLTICSFLPYPLFIINLPFGLVGLVIWTGLMPRILRDIWRPARRHHLPPLG